MLFKERKNEYIWPKTNHHPWVCLGVNHTGTFRGFGEIEGALPAPVPLQPLQAQVSYFSHSSGGRWKVHLPWHKEFSQDRLRSAATSSTASLMLVIMWHMCPIWRPQAGQLARTQGIYSQSAPEPVSGIDSDSRAAGVSPLVTGKNYMWLMCSLTLSLSLGEDIFSVWPVMELSVEPHCLGNSRALTTA